ncbi:GNAT family N-acetyltransferase [Thermodesulfobacteriota bacterium]
MKRISSANDIFKRFGDIKRSAEAFTSNIFFSQAKAQYWFEREDFFFECIGEVFFLFRKDGDFFHLFFVAPGSEALGEALTEMVAKIEFTLVIDFLGSAKDVEGLCKLFTAHGFSERRKLARMTRVVEDKLPEIIGEEATFTFAEAGDELAILELIAEGFDPYSEQFPTFGEVEKAINNRTILLFKDEGCINGLVFFELTGISSALRFLYVKETFRRRGLGLGLMRAYIEKCSNVKRFVLWVTLTNSSAIKLYKNLGYKLETLIDLVMIRIKTT